MSNIDGKLAGVVINGIRTDLVTHAALAALHTSGSGHINLEPLSYSAIGQGTWTWTAAANLYNGGLIDCTPADGDNISWQLYLEVGTYTLRVVMYEIDDSGIVDWDIDGVEVGSTDFYASGAVANETRTVTDIVITTAGLKTLKARVDGKHGSSSNYKSRINHIALWRTA